MPSHTFHNEGFRMEFEGLFKLITGNLPFPWQRALYERFVVGGLSAGV